MQILRHIFTKYLPFWQKNVFGTPFVYKKLGLICIYKYFFVSLHAKIAINYINNEKYILYI